MKHARMKHTHLKNVRTKLRQKKEAFTLMEILIVSIIIAGLLIGVGGTIQRQMKKIRRQKARTMLAQIKGEILEHLTEKGRYPKDMDELVRALETKDNEPPKDVWGSEIIYNNPPDLHRPEYKRYELVSPGPSKEEDNLDDNIHVGE